jgi:hypothetical protein
MLFQKYFESGMFIPDANPNIYPGSRIPGPTIYPFLNKTCYPNFLLYPQISKKLCELAQFFFHTNSNINKVQFCDIFEYK